MLRLRNAAVSIVFVFGAAFLAIAVSAVALAQENAWTSHGPKDVGRINDLAITSSAAYAATPNGVFRSDDSGATWHPAGLNGQSVFKIEARPGADAIFALVQGVLSSSSNLYVSRDSGLTWTSTFAEDYAAVVGIDREQPSTVYAGSAGDASIWKSTDAGATWQKVSTLPLNDPALGLALNSNAIYVLNYDSLYKSVDGGVSWAVVAPAAGVPSAIAVGAADGVVYAAVGQSFCRSADSAATWTCSNFPPGSAFPASRILEIPAEGGAIPRLLVASSYGLMLSSDASASWKPIAGDLASANSPPLASDLSGSLVLAGTQKQVFRTHDRGDTWAPGQAGLEATWIAALALNPRDPSTVWAGAYFDDAFGPGLFVSIDAGLTWSPPGDPAGPQSVHAIAIDPEHPTNMYAGGRQLYWTQDGGQTWAPSTPRALGGLNALALDPDSSQRVLAGGSELYRSDDGARTWEPASIAQDVYAILFDDRHPGTVYAGSYWDVDTDYYGTNGGSVWVSRDHGATFTKGAFDLPAEVLALAADPFRDGTLYAGTTQGFFRSDDGGATWEIASQGLADPSAGFAGLLLYETVFQVVADPVRPGSLYCSTLYGVYRTTDSARTWQPFSNGLAPLETVALVISPDGRRMHAGTDGGGVFELDLDSAAPTAGCVPSASRLCLVGGRYAVDLIATPTNSGLWTPGAAQLLGDRAGFFSLPFATGDPDLPEVVVKMLADGTFGSSSAPVFYSSLTTLPFYITVTDTLTGQRRSHASNPDAPFCGGVDIPTEPSAESTSWRAAPKAEATALQLLGGRFSVTLEARRPGSGDTVGGVPMASGDRFGFFSLPAITGDPQFPEVVVKMLDATAIAGKFWVFHTGLTSLEYTLTVTDSVTGAIKTYQSATPFCGAADTNAF